MVIYDETKNRIQEFSSDASFRVEKIAEMKSKPGKKTRKSLKVKYITNDDMPKYMKAEDYEDHSEDEHHEVVPNVQQQPEFFDDSSNKCDVDTAEAHDIISDSEEILAPFNKKSKSQIEKMDKAENKQNPLKRTYSGTKHAPNLMNLDSEAAFFDLFHDEEPECIKR